MRIATRGRLLLALAAALALTNCATALFLNRDAALKADQGIALLRWAGNQQSAWQGLVLEREGSRGKQVLYCAPFAENSTCLFIGMLPAGRYRPVELRGQWENPQLPAMTTPLVMPLDDRLGTFQVEAGRVTNLGTVIYRETGDVQENRVWTIPNELAHDPTPVPSSALLRDQFPELARALAGKPELGWTSTPPESPARNAKLLADARAFSRRINEPVTAASGALFAGSSLGQVLARDSLRAPWRRLNTGATQEILAVAPLGRGRILVGGEEGFLALSENDGRSWTSLRAVEPERIVRFLGATASGAIVLVAQGEDELRVLTTNDPKGAWRELARIATPRGPDKNLGPSRVGGLTIRWRAPQRDAFIGLSKARLVIYTDPDVLSMYDFAQAKWDTVHTKIPFHHLLVTPEGHLFGAPQIVIQKMWGSADWGRTWQDLDYFTFADVPVFRDAQTGFLAARPYGYTKTWRLMKTTDGGKRWSEMSQLKFLPRHLLVDRVNHALLAFSPKDETYVSTDDGRTWTASN